MTPVRPRPITRMSLRQRLLTTTVFTALTAVFGTPAAAAEFELYGQVNKGLFAYDDGRGDTEAVIVDNDFSSTRFGLKGEQALDNGLTASFLFENELQSNPSNLFTQSPDGGAPISNGNGYSQTGATGTTFSERQARVGLSGAYGGVYVGQQSTAIDGARTADLAGVSDVMGTDYSKIGGGLRVTPGTAPNTINGLAPLYAEVRDDSVRYDSPILLGLQARASIAQSGDPELGLFYDGGTKDVKIKAGLGYQANSTGFTSGVNNRYDASVSALHTSGFGGTVAYQTYDVDGGGDADSWYTKVGYAWDAYAVAADIGRSNTDAGARTAGSLATLDGTLKTFGLGAQYDLGHGVSAAVLYRNFDPSVASLETSNVDVYGVNMRVKF